MNGRELGESLLDGWWFDDFMKWWTSRRVNSSLQKIGTTTLVWAGWTGQARLTFDGGGVLGEIATAPGHKGLTEESLKGKDVQGIVR